MQYRIISVSGFTHATKIERLTREVNEAIALGWEPLGAVVLQAAGHYAQAMIKRR